MAYINFHTVSCLINICSVDVFSKGSFNARAILKKLLKNARDKIINCNLHAVLSLTFLIKEMYVKLWSSSHKKSLNTFTDSILASAVYLGRCTEDLVG